MERKVEFYRIHLDYLPLLSDEDKIKNKFVNTLLKNVNINEPYTLKQDTEDTSIRIEVLEIDQDSMFGVLGKLEDIKDGILKRLRKKEDNEIIDPQSEPINFLIENYTYFYVRFSDMQCAVITNNAAPRFRKHFNNYLKAMVEGKITELESVLVVTRLDNRIKYKLNRFKKLHQIKMIYDDSSEIGNRILSLSDVYDISQSNIKEARIDIIFYGTPLPEKARKLLSNDEIVKSNFKRFEMYGEDDDKEQIEIELVENILIKRVTIDIDNKYLRYSNDLDKIKQALADSFPVT